MDQEMREVMERLEKNSRRQTAAAVTQCVISVLSLICAAAALMMVLMLAPKIQQMTDRTEEFIATAEEALEDVQLASEKLSELDLGPVLVEIKGLLENVDGLLTNVDSLVSDVDTLVGTTQNGLEDTLEKIEKVDFDKLNKAIGDLAAVVEPLAKFFNSFSR